MRIEHKILVEGNIFIYEIDSLPIYVCMYAYCARYCVSVTTKHVNQQVLDLIGPQGPDTLVLEIEQHVCVCVSVCACWPMPSKQYVVAQGALN